MKCPQIAFVYGTRPEAAKLAPLVRQLDPSADLTLYCTGQHTTLLRDGLGAKLARHPGYVNLTVAATPDPQDYPRALDKALRGRLIDHAHPPYDWVVVQGDTASAYAGAVLASTLELPIAHVEAGVRSGDRADPYPEEGFRIAIDSLAEAHYCATKGNMVNVVTEQPWAKPVLTGNTGIDALFEDCRPTDPKERANRCLVTLHRRETLESGRISQVIDGLLTACRLLPRTTFFWPLHPNPLIEKAIPKRNRPTNLRVIGPLPHATFTDMLAFSSLVLTDSGGVQEEAAALGIPAAIARRVTDRPESVDLGLAILAGTTAQGVTRAIVECRELQIRPSLCFGDGTASSRIADHLLAL